MALRRNDAEAFAAGTFTNVGGITHELVLVRAASLQALPLNATLTVV